jgi:hypothetical protein
MQGYYAYKHINARFMGGIFFWKECYVNIVKTKKKKKKTPLVFFKGKKKSNIYIELEKHLKKS